MKNMVGKLAVACLGLVVVATAARADEFVVVTVQGEGISEEAAKNDALRKALEQGGKQEISSRSESENFVLVRDTIYARADGIVSDYKVLQQGEGIGGVYFCKIEAKVNKSAIASSWGEVQNVLDQLGRPGVAVSIVEKIDGVVDNSSILESKIEERLIESGFDVYNSAHLQAKLGKESADAAAESDVAKMMAIAKDFSTQIFISGACERQSGRNNAGSWHAVGDVQRRLCGENVLYGYWQVDRKQVPAKLARRCARAFQFFSTGGQEGVGECGS